MRATRVDIDLGALRHNLQRVRRAAPHSRVMAAIKANGYGHGLVRVAQALAQADALGVACVDEAVQLREAGIGGDIAVLEGFFHRSELHEVWRNELQVVVHQEQQLVVLEHSGRLPLCWLKIDTGMGRLGFASEHVAGAWQRLTALDPRRALGFMTHLANADERDDPTTEQQLRCFEAAIGERAGMRSVANSAGILAWPAAHADWVRPGIMLYGVSPFPGRCGKDEGLRPVMSLRSELIAVKTLPAGHKVGYGGTWSCPETMPVGVVAVGYGDGYPRHAGTGTPVWIGGHRVPIIGRVSMDMVTVDLRAHPHASIGDAVELWGPNLPVERVAECAGTIAYELLCGITSRVQVRELDAGEQAA